MKRVTWTLAILAAASVATVMAQPPGGGPGPGGPGGPGGGPGGRGGPPGGPPPNPVIEALDTNHDRVIDADELKAAPTSLLALDKNKDGKLTEDEFRPAFGRGPEGGRAGGGRDAGTRNRDSSANTRGAPGNRSDSNAGRGPGGNGPEGRGPGGPGGQDGPPPRSPERFVEHAMEFDADKDGKLSKEELMKFAEDVHRRQEGPGGPGGGPGQDGPPPRDGGRPDAGERPKRPE